MIIVRRAQLADVPAVAPLFDAYRQFYGKQRSRSKGAIPSFCDSTAGQDGSEQTLTSGA
jgi:hypothetical protein